MESRPLLQEDASSVWIINEQGLPGTGKVTVEEISHLIAISDVSLGVFEQDKMLGFVICLSPNLDYGSLNYAWFNENYDDFLYVDRIAVATEHRNNGIGSFIYQELINISQQKQIPITAEVNLVPPNPGSMKFHFRFDFSEVGVLNHLDKSVTMFLRQVKNKF
ncbi:MAG: GNAT family N-acetyltransferase [Candidatus Poseidoniaceae archaeon]|nr:GNAT family N-acetyltransferase [Candidatus Poseidoniaceae archaeon]